MELYIHFSLRLSVKPLQHRDNYIILPYNNDEWWIITSLNEVVVLFQLRLLDTSFSLWRLGFSSGPIHVTFLMEEVTL
jgi:hypothetical protein